MSDESDNENDSNRFMVHPLTWRSEVSIVLIKHDLFIMYAECNFWKDSMSTMKPS